MSRKCIFITGISGFAGKYLAEFYASRGETVLGSYWQNKPVFKYSSIRPVKMPLTDGKLIKDVLCTIKPEKIFHLAAESIPRESWKDPAKTFSTNSAGTIHLLQAIRCLKYHPRFIFASTNLVYGRKLREDCRISEKSLLWPEDPYAFSKAAAEMACLNFFKQWGMDIVIARPFNHIGPRQSERLVFSEWSRQIAAAEKKGLPSSLKVGNLDAFRDILHVQDVISAYHVLSERGIAGEIYNICSGKAVQLNDLAKYLMGLSRVAMTLVVESGRKRTGDPPFIRGDNRKIFALGWNPQSNVFQALSDLLDDWRERIRKKSDCYV